MRSDLTNVERFVGLFLKIDELHLSGFREMRLKSKGDFDLITPHILFPWNLDKTFENFIGNFTVAKKVKTQVAYRIS